MTNLTKTGLEEKLKVARDKHKNLRIKTKPKNLGTKIPGMRTHLGGVHEQLDAVEKNSGVCLQMEANSTCLHWMANWMRY